MATQPPYPGAVTPPPNSGLAITALVLGVAGLVSCGLVTGIPAMILGRFAIREIDDSQGRLGGRGMATGGFWMGLAGTVWSLLVLAAVVATFVIGISFFVGFWDAICGSEVEQEC